MKIKHFIITRFLNNDKMNLKERVFDEDVLSTGVRLVKSYLIPSLEHQSNKNFTSILIIHDNVNKEYIKELYELVTSFKLLILTTTDYKKFIKTEYNKCDYDFFITSRVDYDDMFYYNAVQDVQSSVSMNRPLIVYTWRNGRVKNEKDKVYRSFSPAYMNRGGIGIMLTLIISKNMHVLDNSFNVYNYNHTIIGDKVREFFSLSYDPLIVNMNNDPCWVYIRHEQTDSRCRKEHNSPLNFDINKFYNIV